MAATFTFGSEDLTQLAGGTVPDWLRYDADAAIDTTSLIDRLTQIRDARITGPEKDAVEQCIAAAKEILGDQA